AADRGQVLFAAKAKCSSCHVPPLFTEPGHQMHSAEEMGIDDFQAKRSPEGRFYKTMSLRGLFARTKGGFYHDGRFKDLTEVVQHYNKHFKLQLSNKEVNDLIEYLKSL
ncbi:MAG: c-type cytochrome, partial [Chitinophagaceae bacterium]|nr:c-type cytochrome [Chitinophagaceae bacterium]